MRQARTVLSTYSADVFGVCSALYELGGLIVIHDASGCNSTYSTHDEPRWGDGRGMVYISALTEMEAIMGDDVKLMEDVKQAVKELHPKFVALAGTPIPMMTGCDLESIAKTLEGECGIPCFGFPTSGMGDYVSGASAALETLALEMTAPRAQRRPGTVNLLGATPLDFSLSGSVESMKVLLEQNGWQVLGTWAMGSDLADIRRAGEAAVNLVISSAGIRAAKALAGKFGTPYVVGTPTGSAFSQKILELLRQAAGDGQCRIAFSEFPAPAGDDILILGESVMSRSLGAALAMECGVRAKTLCTLEAPPEGVLSPGDRIAAQEEDIQIICKNAKTVIADPLYRPILPENCRLIPLPHEAFSGRIGRKDIPDMTKLNLLRWYGKTKEGKLI